MSEYKIPTRIERAKDKVKTHFATHKAKYALVGGVVAGSLIQSYCTKQKLTEQLHIEDSEPFAFLNKAACKSIANGDELILKPMHAGDPDLIIHADTPTEE